MKKGRYYCFKCRRGHNGTGHNVITSAGRARVCEKQFDKMMKKLATAPDKSPHLNLGVRDKSGRPEGV